CPGYRDHGGAGLSPGRRDPAAQAAARADDDRCPADRVARGAGDVTRGLGAHACSFRFQQRSGHSANPSRADRASHRGHRAALGSARPRNEEGALRATPPPHLEVHPGDREAAAAFLAELLGWRPELIRAGSGSYFAGEGAARSRLTDSGPPSRRTMASTLSPAGCTVRQRAIASLASAPSRGTGRSGRPNRIRSPRCSKSEPSRCGTPFTYTPTTSRVPSGRAKSIENTGVR